MPVLVEQQDPIAELWWAGDLSYLHHEDGERFWRMVNGTEGRIFTKRCTRRYGKSYGAAIDAIEYGITEGTARAPIRFAAPTMVDAWEIIAPHIDEIIEDAPTPIRPVWRDRKLHFHTGCVLHLSGCDDRRKANRLRGRSMGRGYIDEAGSIPDFHYVLHDVLLPQTLTTGGKVIVLSSPSDSPAHESTATFRAAELAGRGVHRTIYDAPHITDDLRVEFMRECVPTLTEDEAWAYVRARSGPDDPTWQREYMAELVVDIRRAVVPEFGRVKPLVVRAVPQPAFFDSYVSLDVGFHDLSFAGLGFLDFEAGALVIEDEVVMHRRTSDVLDAAIEEKERALWSDRSPPMDHPHHKRPERFGVHEPRRRVVDAPDIVVAEMRKEGRRPWYKPDKDDSDAAINAMRKRIGNAQVLIHPRCTHLVDHLEHAIWNRNRTSYVRPEDTERYGHFDGVDMVKYMVRHVDWQRNPFPTALDRVHRQNERVKSGERLADEKRQKGLGGLVRRPKRVA